MGSPAYFGKLANFVASLRKPGLVPFGLFNAQDNLAFVADLPSSGHTLTPATVAYSAAPAFDTSTGDVLTIILTGNVTSSTLNYGGSSSIPTGTRVYLKIQEDGVGGHTFVLPTNLHTDSYVIDTRANRFSMLPIRWNSTTSLWEFFSDAFSGPAT